MTGMYFDEHHPTHPLLKTSRHGFRVKYPQPPTPWEDDPYTAWGVDLPHQCDAWEITGDVDTRDEAIQRLEEFIAEAREALQLLREAPSGQAENGPLSEGSIQEAESVRDRKANHA